MELIKTVHRGQVFIAIAEMILADLRRRIAQRLEDLRNGRIGRLQSLLGGRQAHFEQAGAKGCLPGDEGRASGCAGLLPVVISEQRTLAGQSVDVRRVPAHHASMVGADVPDADIIGHDHDDVGLLVVSIEQLR